MRDFKGNEYSKTIHVAIFKCSNLLHWSAGEIVPCFAVAGSTIKFSNNNQNCGVRGFISPHFSNI